MATRDRLLLWPDNPHRTGRHSDRPSRIYHCLPVASCHLVRHATSSGQRHRQTVQAQGGSRYHQHQAGLEGSTSSRCRLLRGVFGSWRHWPSRGFQSSCGSRSQQCRRPLVKSVIHGVVEDETTTTSLGPGHRTQFQIDDGVRLADVTDALLATAKNVLLNRFEKTVAKNYVLYYYSPIIRTRSRNSLKNNLKWSDIVLILLSSQHTHTHTHTRVCVCVCVLSIYKLNTESR